MKFEMVIRRGESYINCKVVREEDARGPDDIFLVALEDEGPFKRGHCFDDLKPHELSVAKTILRGGR